MKKILFFLGLSFCLNSFAQVPSYVPINGLIGWWPLSGNTDDESGNSNHGSNTGATLTTDRFGHNDSAYNFDGTQYIQAPSLNLPSFTLNVWVKIDTTGFGTNRAIISKHFSGSINNSSYIFMSNYNPSSAPRLYYTNTSSAPYWTDGPTSLDDDWHMLTGTLDVANLKLYIDGVLVNNGIGGVSSSNSIPLLFGAYHSNSGVITPSFKGKIDDIGVWNRSLTQCEISVLYNSQTLNGTDTQSACDSYTWVDGNTYTTSNNSATYTTSNATGCDSTITLDLTITNSTSSTDTQSACDSYTWVDGNTYTTSNNSATHTISNAAGCDSTITLNLTINPTPDNSITQNGASLTATQTGATYQWIDCDNFNAPITGEVNQVFFPLSTGNYAVEVTIGDCSSISECRLVDFTGLGALANMPKQLIKIVDLLGRETTFKSNKVLVYIYSDGTVEKNIIFE
ncbi:LamG domain-containing protein [Crocinitomicaceae bacterium]|nr:LamG domain-containing protein [Crocinitomicaceae bacterium]